MLHLDLFRRPRPALTSRAARSLVLGLTAFVITCGSTLPVSAGEPTSTARAVTPVSRPVVCTGAVQHPIDVRVRALDPIRRGSPVRLAVEVRSRVALERVETTLVSAGGATVQGASRIRSGALAGNRTARGEFRLMVPAQGDRHYVSFQVRGEGPRGTITRGASFNILPDGPADVGRERVASDGTRLLEFRAGGAR